MIIPPGFMFIPTDEVLIKEYLERKANDEPLPCDIVFEREIYGAGNKAPWQIFDKNDPWQENTVYVITKLFKASSKGRRIARTAGCGSWHGETGPKSIFDDKRPEIIGLKRMLRFRITNESEVLMDDEGSRWIMHEFSLPGGKGEYILCRIRRDDSKKTTKKSLKEVENLEAVNSSDADFNLMAKTAKRVREEEFERDKKTTTESPETKVIPHAKVLYDIDAKELHDELLASILESEQQSRLAELHDELASILESQQQQPSLDHLDIDAELHDELLASILESEQQPSLDHLDAVYPQTLSWLPSTPISSGHACFGL